MKTYDSSLTITRRSAFATACVVLSALAFTAQASPPPPVIDDCSALRVKDFTKVPDAPTKVMMGTLLKVATLSDADAWQVRRRSRAMGAALPEETKVLPAHCLVEGYVNPHIKFQLRLPDPKKWNGKFLLSACDGFCGKLSPDHTMAGVMQHYATMTTDGGHWGEHPFDGVWAMDNLQARIDFGYRANHVLLRAAKAIVKTYYGSEQRYSYMTGCSKGGQAGVMTAARYPEDFDGVIARGPTINYTKVNALRCADTFEATVSDDGKVLLGAEKTAFIQKSVMDYCDEKDALKDRLISDPRKCDFDAVSIQCGKPGVTSGNCLTETEATALKRLYAPIKDKRGKQIYAGVTKGSEMEWPAWALPVDGDTNIYASQCSGDFFKYMAFRKSPGPHYDFRKSFDWDRDNHLLADMSPVWDADTPDLTAFRDAGGKMIVVHGWSDEAIPAPATIEWYEKVSAYMGGRDKVIEFARLFLLPGVTHCDGGVGPGSYNALELLEAWVERGVAPDTMMTQRYTDGELERSRPAYPFPIEARYKGSGSIDDAKNFAPHDPRRR